MERGVHGGLGSQGKQQTKRKAETTAATQALLGEGGKKKSREFHTTTASAVAAGHWDPWARPVEFKMKQVNRRVGGLYSMFVKGETMGGTLSEAKDESKPAKTKKAKKAKKEKNGKNGATEEKKQKKQAEAAGAASSTSPGAAAAEPSEEHAFNWKKTIKAQLRAAEGQQMPLKRLLKRTVAACQAHGGAGAAPVAEMRATFAKKLAKTSGVVTVGDDVRMSK